MISDQQWATLRSALQRVDWTYNYSDDHREWQHGHRAMARLNATWQSLAKDATEAEQGRMRELWAELAPPSTDPPAISRPPVWGRPNGNLALRSDGMRAVRQGFSNWVLYRPDGRPIEGKRGNPIRFRSAYDAIAHSQEESL